MKKPKHDMHKIPNSSNSKILFCGMTEKYLLSQNAEFFGVAWWLRTSTSKSQRSGFNSLFNLWFSVFGKLFISLSLWIMRNNNIYLVTLLWRWELYYQKFSMLPGIKEREENSNWLLWWWSRWWWRWWWSRW